MAQLIHDLVPSADLAFRTAFGGANSFANGIQELADEDCDIIVDNVSKFFFCISVAMILAVDLTQVLYPHY